MPGCSGRDRVEIPAAPVASARPRRRFGVANAVGSTEVRSPPRVHSRHAGGLDTPVTIRENALRVCGAGTRTQRPRPVRRRALTPRKVPWSKESQVPPLLPTSEPRLELDELVAVAGHPRGQQIRGYSVLASALLCQLYGAHTQAPCFARRLSRRGRLDRWRDRRAGSCVGSGRCRIGRCYHRWAVSDPCGGDSVAVELGEVVGCH